MSTSSQHNKDPKRINKKGRNIIVVIMLIAMLFGVLFVKTKKDHHKSKTATSNPVLQKEGIENGIHVLTGLKEGEGLNMVIANCTGCHSAKIITQNRMDRAHWNETIKWMQETQNLWDLGENQEVIVNYLVTNYPIIENKGRRSNLNHVEWYELEDK